MQQGILGHWALAVVFAVPAAAQDLAPPPAIGELTYGTWPGAAICTATLVAPDLVLTAGHCLRQKEGGPAMDPTHIRFSAGRSGDAALAEASGVAILFPQAAAPDGAAILGDLGLLRLDRPIASALIQPLPLGDAGQAGLLAMIGYRRDAPHLPVVNPDCGILTSQQGLLGLSCPAVSGNSGAPLLVQSGDGWAIAAVMVARDRSHGLIASWAVVPGPDLAAAIAPPAP